MTETNDYFNEDDLAAVTGVRYDGTPADDLPGVTMLYAIYQLGKMIKHFPLYDAATHGESKKNRTVRSVIF